MSFQLPRLTVAELTHADYPYFVELVTAPEIVTPVPQVPWSQEKIDENFAEFINYPEHPRDKERKVWGIFEKDKSELIGLLALLTNDEDQPEIGYRFHKKYWGKGYATEVTQFLIDYAFNTLRLPLITADVNVKNLASVRVLEKFFKPVREFYNERDKSTDRRYVLHRDGIKTSN